LKDFQYTAATTVEEAIGLLAEQRDRGQVLAGGTDIIVQLREGQRDADLVVDIKKIPELVQYNYSAEGGLTLGAAVPCCQIYGDAELVAAYAGLVDATKIIGGWQIQSRASVGGNLCNSSPAADAVPALIAYDAVCVIAGPEGRRELPVADFCTGPGKNVLDAGEILVALKLPAQTANSGGAYQRFIPRNEMDIAVAGAGTWVQLDASGTTIEAARISLGAVAPTAVVATAACEFLVGKPANDETYAAAGELAKQVASPISDMRGTAEFRTNLAGVLTKRTLATAVERARA
jgi:xanthine dehydrogenase FAD-binding subunit